MEDGVQVEPLELLEPEGLAVRVQLVVQLPLHGERMLQLVEPRRLEVLVVLAELDLPTVSAEAQEQEQLQQGAVVLPSLPLPLE